MMTDNTQWQGAWSLFETEAEAVARYNEYIALVRQTPSRYATIIPITKAGENTWVSGEHAPLTDAEILEGNFTGYYSVTSQFSSETSVGVEAAQIPDMITQYENIFIAMVPTVEELAV